MLHRTKPNAPNGPSALYCQLAMAGASSKQDRTTAPSPGRLNGLVIRWLAPARRARSTSASADSDVKTSTGIDCVCGLRPDMPADLDPVDARHHHVEDCQVELFGVELAQRLGAVLGLGDFESFHAEIQPDHMQQSRFVIDEKDALLGQRVRPPGRVDRWFAPVSSG